MPILWPIDASVKEPIWLICDTSVSGIGAMYSQGKTWETCHPAGFMSKKFSLAQFSYKTWDQEALVIIESLQKWEDKLLRRWINVVTDHKALGFFKDQTCLSGCQARW